MGQPVVHWEIAGKDAKKLQGFYADLFDWKVEMLKPDPNSPMEYGMVQTGGEGGINGGITTAPKDAPYVTFYIQVDDLQTYLDKAEGLGGKTVVPPMEIPGAGHMAMFADPEGNVIGLWK